MNRDQKTRKGNKRRKINRSLPVNLMNQAGNAHQDLTVEWNELRASWQDSRSVWKDDVASQFEKRFMGPLETEIPVFLTTLEALQNELQDAWRELQ
jgi:hypothetical protein